jgi:6,7-dimethyl-8-ribityllumazine synthase
MLQKLRSQKERATGTRFAIVASIYNTRYVDGMLRAAKAHLRSAGATEIKVVRVPGAFEIPVVAAALARQTEPAFHGVICLGVILRGATHHAQTICDAITQSLARVAVDTGVPVIHEVLMVENEQQAKERCLDPQHNRGAEAAQTAVAMAKVMKGLR